ncbi:hypothetical protein IFR05_005740 [Cadophora sp. M221]|nr:hypothetical protein IFR05_005740 [Cadophora sp. M221]
MPSTFSGESPAQPSAFLPAAGIEQSLRQPWKELIFTEVAARLKADEDEVGRQNQERLKEAYKGTGPTICVVDNGTGR